MPDAAVKVSICYCKWFVLWTCDPDDWANCDTHVGIRSTIDREKRWLTLGENSILLLVLSHCQMESHLELWSVKYDFITFIRLPDSKGPWELFLLEILYRQREKGKETTQQLTVTDPPLFFWRRPDFNNHEDWYSAIDESSLVVRRRRGWSHESVLLLW